MADALRVDDQVVLFAPAAVLDDMVDELLLIVVVFFRNEDVLCAVGNAAPKGDVAGVAAHDLDDGAALVGGGCVLDLVDGVHGGVDCRVKADRVLGAGDVQVDRAGQADGVDALSGQRLGAAVGAVAADDDDAVDAVLAADVRRFGLDLGLLELKASGRAEDGAAALDDIGHVHGLHLEDLLVEQALVASHDALDLDSVGQCFTHHRTDGGIHSGSVSAAGQHADCIEFFLCFHINLLGRGIGKRSAGFVLPPGLC